MYKAFFAYSHDDETHLNALKKHLHMLERQKIIEFWHDRNVHAGQEWNNETVDRLAQTDIYFLLVSASFLASKYCYDVEMARALEAHTAGRAKVIPILLRDCDFANSPLQKIQCVPRDGKAATSWPNVDAAYHSICQEIWKIIGTLTKPIPEAEAAVQPTSRQMEIALPGYGALNATFVGVPAAGGHVFVFARPLPLMETVAGGIRVRDPARAMLATRASEAIDLAERRSELSGIGLRLPKLAEWRRALQGSSGHMMRPRKIRPYGSDVFLQDYCPNDWCIGLPPEGIEEWIRADGGGAFGVGWLRSKGGRVQCVTDFNVSHNGGVRAAVRLVFDG